MNIATFLKLLGSMGVIGVASIAFQGSVIVYAPPGASVLANSLFGACESGSVCEFPLASLPFQDQFEIKAAEGYRAAGWSRDTHQSCDISLSTCEPHLTAKNFPGDNATQYDSAKFQAVIESTSAETRTAWQYPAVKRWAGKDLEGAINYCGEAAIRWIGPTVDFDVNKDGIQDVLMHISCYQEAWPANPQEIHNIEVVAAWKMLCSDATASHYDCTEELFGSEVINTTSSQGGGGNPYVHVMNKPRDLNGDGYPEFWYALNRDDGRTAFPEGTQEENQAWIERLCGPDATTDCTRDSYQSMLISNSDGTYQVAFAATPPVNCQAVEVFPNLLGTFDMVMFNYGVTAVSRWTGTEFVDVTDEWHSYTNYDYAIERGNVYVHAFTDELTQETYLIVPNVHEALVGRERLYKDIAREPDLHLGFSLWRFDAGEGFTLSDYYIPDDDDLFVAKVGDDPESANYTLQEGVYIHDIPTLLPNYFHMKVTRMSSNGELVLFMQQENDGGAPFGDFLKQPIDEDRVYYLTNGGIETSQGYLAGPLSPIQTFYIRDGKLEETPQPLIEAGFVWNTPGMFFQDFNGDGHIDMLGKSGHQNRGSIYINDGTGKLSQRRISSASPQTWFHDRKDAFNYGAYPLHLDQDNKLDLMFWHKGDTRAYEPEGPGEIVIMKGSWDIEEFEHYQPAQLNNDIALCYKEQGWFGSCSIF
jgi:hypothetical protein